MQTENKKFNSTHKILIASLLIIGLVGCSSESTPAPRKLYRNIQAISSTTIISVIAQNSYPMPEKNTLIEQSGNFRTINDVYDAADNRILIPSGAIIGGSYSNDGGICRVIWKSVYANNGADYTSENAVSIAQVTEPTKCDSVKGVKVGDRLEIRFSEEVSK